MKYRNTGVTGLPCTEQEHKVAFVARFAQHSTALLKAARGDKGIYIRGHSVVCKVSLTNEVGLCNSAHNSMFVTNATHA
jgi:hypothetical protein